MKGNNYLIALTFPRFLLAIAVVIYHFGLHLSFFKDKIWGSFLSYAGVCVSFFFFLSGLVLTYNYLNKDFSLKGFYFKRFSRLYPTYIITLLITFALMFIFLNQLPTNTISFFSNLFGLQAWYVGYALELNFPSWSLSVEFFFYFLFPFIIKILKKISFKNAAILTLVIWTLGLIQHAVLMYGYYDEERWFVNQFILYFPLFHLSTFIAGTWTGYLILKIQKNQNLIKNLWPLTWIGSCLFLYLMSTDNLIRLLGHNGAFVPIFALICIGLSFPDKLIKYIFGNRLSVFLGNISYSIYMWQFIVYLVFTRITNTIELTSLNFFIYLLTLILVSAITYKTFEVPVNRFLNKTKKFIGLPI